MVGIYPPSHPYNSSAKLIALALHIQMTLLQLLKFKSSFFSTVGLLFTRKEITLPFQITKIYAKPAFDSLVKFSECSESE